MHGWLLARLLVAASVSGKVVWTSAVPPLTVRAPTDPHVCGRQGPVARLRVQAGPGGVIPAAVVFIDPPVAPPAPPGDARIRVRNCQFGPRILVLAAGSTLSVENDDPLLHNVHVRDESGRSIANYTLPLRGQRTPPIVLTRPGAYRIESDAGHFWMNAWVWVVAHGSATQTDEQGRFRLYAPPGRYSIVAWHPDLGITRATVVLSNAAEAAVELLF